MDARLATHRKKHVKQQEVSEVLTNGILEDRHTRAMLSALNNGKYSQSISCKLNMLCTHAKYRMVTITLYHRGTLLLLSTELIRI